MITEDYVSFEVAKLLKEKGFDEYCLKNYWSTDKELHNWNWELSYRRNSDGNRDTRDCAAPTLQMAMKWLREVHNILIAIEFTSPEDDSLGYNCYFEIYDYDVRPIKIGNGCYSTSCYSTYEEACEAAIKYCLENLI